MGSVTTLAVATLGAATTLVLVRDARLEVVRERAARHRATDRLRWLPPAVSDRLAVALAASGIDLTPADAIRVTIFAAVAAAIVGGVLAPPLAALGAFATFAGAAGALRLARHRSDQRTEAAIPELLEHVASELRSGGSVRWALDAAAERGGPLAHDLGRIRRRFSLGAGSEDALAPWASERPTSGVAEAAGALVVAVEAGPGAADALDALAASLRDRLAVVAEARSLATQARLSAVVVAGAPVGYLVWSALVDRRTFAALVGTPLGRVCLGVGLAFEAVGALWSRRILRVVA